MIDHVLVDSSVLLKWFHSDAEDEVPEARALRAAHEGGRIDAHVLDLGIYEVGNVLVRALGWSAGRVAARLDDLLVIIGPALTMEEQWLRDAARLAERHRLSFYDAAWAATAKGLRIPLVSADRKLLNAALAVTPTDLVSRWGLLES